MKLWKGIDIIHPGRTQRILFHVLFWLLLLTLRLYLSMISFNVYSGLSWPYTALLHLSGTGLVAAVYYLLTGPVHALFIKRRRVRAGLCIIAILLAYTMADTVLEQVILRSCSTCMAALAHNQPAYYQLLTSHFTNIVLKRLLGMGTPMILLLTLSIPLCIKLALNSWRNQVKNLQLAKSNIELEFRFLKSQINPHSLFNTLNNIYGLILKEDTVRSAALVARLSAQLRYMLYESNKSHMPLSRELELLKDYVELEKIRLNETIVRSEIRAEDIEYEIPPLLLIPLVENAFKFSADEPGACIDLSLDITGGRMLFSLNNAITEARVPANGHGIGLSNFRKRLDLYYKGRYSYEAIQDRGVYQVKLTIDL